MSPVEPAPARCRLCVGMGRSFSSLSPPGAAVGASRCNSVDQKCARMGAVYVLFSCWWSKRGGEIDFVTREESLRARMAARCGQRGGICTENVSRSTYTGPLLVQFETGLLPGTAVWRRVPGAPVPHVRGHPCREQRCGDACSGLAMPRSSTTSVGDSAVEARAHATLLAWVSATPHRPPATGRCGRVAHAFRHSWPIVCRQAIGRMTAARGRSLRPVSRATHAPLRLRPPRFGLHDSRGPAGLPARCRRMALCPCVGLALGFGRAMRGALA